MLLQQVAVHLLSFRLFTNEIGVEITVTIFQVAQDLAETIKLGGHIHERVAFFLYYLDDLVCQCLKVLF